MLILRIKPSIRKEIIMFSKFFAKSAQMNTKRILSMNIVHSQEVVNSLPRQHRTQKIRLDTVVLPPYFPLEFFVSVPAGGGRIPFFSCPIKCVDKIAVLVFIIHYDSVS